MFEALKRGEKFTVSLLLNEHESVRLFWDWWWAQAPKDQLTRPYSVADEDPWLIPTKGKTHVDTESYREYLSDFALLLQDQRILRRGHNVLRTDYRSELVQHVVKKAARLEHPTVVLTGGGYGAGKTTATDFLVRCHKLPIGLGAVTGVDYFKAYLPEFSMLQHLADGRASSVVQDEARMLANDAFSLLVGERLSFAWDSSMSNFEDTEPRLITAKKQGYRLILIAVFAPLEIAIRHAMSRARKTRRFANPAELPRSHTQFRLNFPRYLPYFDQVLVFVNEGTAGAGGLPNISFVAQKAATDAKLAIFDQDRFAKFVA